MLIRIAVLYLVAMVFFAWGVAMTRYEIFPYFQIYPVAHEVINFIKGHEEEEKSVLEKLINDTGIKPLRQMVPGRVQNKREYIPLALTGLNERREMPVVYAVPGKQARGYKFIFGAIDFEAHLHGAILLDNDNRVVHKWILDDKPTADAIDEYNNEIRAGLTPEENEKFKGKRLAKPELRFPHGVTLLTDGSVIYNDGDPANGIMRIDACGERTWTRIGAFHHTVHPDHEDNSIWAQERGFFVKLSQENSADLKRFKIPQILHNNPDLGLLSERFLLISGKRLEDPYHPNDIEALPAAFADRFPLFEAGDLLLSMRSQNLILVIDPDTYEVKWWRSGQTRRQHDPDWQADGTITVFDNNMRDKGAEEDKQRFSRIWRIDPQSFKAEMIYDGKMDNFYSQIRGKHQLLPNGNILITSTQQGRVLEVTPQGETVFDFRNIYDENLSLVVSEAIWVPEDYFGQNLQQAKLCNP